MISIILPKEKKQRYTPKDLITKDVRTNIAKYKALQKASPAWASHMLKKNLFIEKMCFDNFGSIQVLEQPVCEGCERPAFWHTGGTAHCFACGRYTKNPITVRDYFEQIVKLSTEQLDILDMTGGELPDGTEAIFA